MKISKGAMAVLTALVFLSTQISASGGTETRPGAGNEAVKKTAAVAPGAGDTSKEARLKEADFKPVAIGGKFYQAPELKKKKFPWLVVAAVVVVGVVVAYFLLKESKPKTGSISVNSSPTGAKIFLEGADQNMMTNAVLKNIAPGSYAIKLVKEGYRDYEGNVTVKEGETATVSATLSANVITVTNPAAGAVWTKGAVVEILWTTDATALNGMRNQGFNPIRGKGFSDPGENAGGTGDAPALQDLGLAITNVNIALYKGGSRITPIATNVSNSGAATWTVPASQADGTDYRVRVECATETSIFGQSDQFSIGTGTISITSNPTGAKVFMDGIDQGKTTNCTLTDVAAGTHRIKLSKDGYLDFTQDVTVTIGQTSSITATLQIGSISVTAPAEDVIWGRGETKTISWSTSVSGNVKIELYAGTSPYSTITSSTENDGSYTWTISSGQAEKMDYKIRISLAADGNIKGDSGYFVIAKKTYAPDFVSSGLAGPVGLTLDSSNYAHVTEYNNNRVAKFYPSAGSPSKTYYGAGGTSLGNFSHPVGIHFDKVWSRVYVVDSGNNRVQQFSGTTYTGAVAIGGTSSGSGNYQFNMPRCIVADQSGNIYVTDRNNARVMKYSPSRSWQGTWSIPGTQLAGIAYSAANNWIFVADRQQKKIFVYAPGGSLLGSWALRGVPNGIAVDSAGFVFATNETNHCFDKYTPDGRLVCSVGSYGDAADQFRYPYDIAHDSSNNVYVVDYTKGTLQKFR